jgi:hypothetical protein
VVSRAGWRTNAFELSSFEVFDGLLNSGAGPKQIHGDANSLERVLGVRPKVAADD